MSLDFGLTADTCIFMNPGAPDWWLSEDVKITNPPSGVAQPGTQNDVQITVRHKPKGCALPANSDFVKVDLYVCNPTASPPVTTSGQVKKILDATSMPPADIVVDFGTSPGQLSPGGSAAKIVKWDLPALPTHPAEMPGHKCLIARAYASPLTGGTNIGDYVSSSDQHYAQRNICILTCSSPCGLDLWTENPEEVRQVKAVTFRLVADVKPSEAVLNIALPLLKQVPGFKRVVNTAPHQGFRLELPDFPDAKIIDNTRLGCWGLIRQLLNPKSVPALSFDANVAIKPGQLSIYRFVTDLDGSEPGDAHVFHLMHMEGGRVLSGLTIVAVKI